MQEKIEMTLATNFNYLPLEKNQEGLYSVPTMRCGVLPFYIDNDDQIIWGCIKSNRVGPITITPPAGIQDIIIMKDELYLSLEVGKPFPDLKLDFLVPFIGELFRDQIYQEIIARLVDNKFNVYVEHPLNTALHETQEEHGVDLGKEGRDRHLLNTLLELPLQKLSGKQGATSQCTYIAFLKNPDGVVLNYTEKIENKIRRNLKRPFYEKGCWGTLDSFKLALEQEKEKFNATEKREEYTPPQLALIDVTLSANQEAIEFLENIELLVKSNLEKSRHGQRLAINVQNNIYTSRMLGTHGIFNVTPQPPKELREAKEDRQYTYCGFKSGFLKGQSF